MHTITAIDRPILVGALNAALTSASKDCTRPHMHGVLLETTETGIRFVSTDGHRLTQIDTANIGEWDHKAGEKHLLPRKDVETLVKALRGVALSYADPITVNVDGSMLKFHHVLGRAELGIQPSDESFPPYAKVIPPKQDTGTNGTNRIGWNPNYMADVAKVAKFCGNTKSGGVEVSIAGECDPVRLDISNGEASAIVVIMPMRV